MAIDIRTFDSSEPGETVAVVNGDLNAVSGRETRNRLIKLMEIDSRNFALDLRHVRRLDSGGLAALIGILRAVRDRGGDVRVIAANDAVRRIFEITALARVF